MERPLPVPDDLAACQALIEQLQERNGALERGLSDQQRELEQQCRVVDEQRRVLDETSACYQELLEEHAAVKEELALIRRWAFGRRRERFVEADGQLHLFALQEGEPALLFAVDESVDDDQRQPRRRRRRQRGLDLSRLPQHRVEHDVPDEEQRCETCGREKDRIGEDLSRVLHYLHADAYGGYDGIYLESDGRIVEVACGAHLRRKFVDARNSAPRESAQVLEGFRQLYDVEDRARELSAEERLALRQCEALPVLERMQAYLDELSGRALPKSSLGKALTYARNQWQAFCRYTTDSRLTIDNNVSERTLRAQAVGRKNWLFLGHEQAGPRAAVLYTILAGAKRHRLEPWVYLNNVLLHLAGGDTADLERFLPDRWAADHPQHVLTHRLEESRQKRARQQTRRNARRR